MTTLHLLRPHLRAGLGSILTIAAIVFALTATAVFAPLAVTSMLDSSTRYRVDALSPVVRDLSAAGPFRPQQGSGPQPSDSLPEEYRATWGLWDSDIARLGAEMEPAMRRSLGEASYYTRLGTPGQFVGTTYVLLDPRFAGRIALVDGRMPELTVTSLEWEEALTAGVDPVTGMLDPSTSVVVPATEIVLSAASAAEVDWGLGETRIVGAEAGWHYDTPVTLVGTFEAVDPDDPFWTRATGVLTAEVGSNPDGVPFVRTAGYVHPDMLQMLSWSTSGVMTELWYPMSTAELTAASAPELLAELRGFTARTHELGTSDGFAYASLAFHTETIDTLDDAVGQNRSLVAVLGMMLSGPLGVALVVLVLGCRMLWERRRAAFDLLGTRGASPRQLRGLLALDGLVAGVVPAAAGAAAAVLLARALLPTVPLTPALLVAPVLLAVLPALVGIATAGRSRGRGRADARGASVWRLVVEAAVVLLAALATTLLLLRGTAATSDQIDPLAAAAPFLLSLAACVLTLRIYPAVLRVVLARQRARRGFVGLLGAARALRDPAVGVAPALALIVGVSFAVAGGIVLSTVQHGAEQSARISIGADLQVQSRYIVDGAVAEVAALDGVAVAAPVGVLPASELFVDDVRVRVSLHLADAAQLADAQRGYPPAVPDGVDLGDGTGPPPLLVSDALGQRYGIDETSRLEIIAVPAAYGGTAAEVAPFATGSNWVLADSAYAAEITDETATTTRLFVRLDAGADAGALASAIADIVGNGARVLTAGDALAAIDGDPAVAGLRTMLLAGIAVSAALSAIAVVVTLVLGARPRSRILALLQTLGAPPRAASRLLVWELAPAGIAALVVGTAFGALLPVLLAAVIDLRAFTGGAAAPVYYADPLILLLTVGGFVVVTVLVTLVALVIARRARAAAVLRTVEDT